MRAHDPRFATCPTTPSVSQLRWYIRQTANGNLTIDELLADIRQIHEQLENLGQPQYASPEEARAIWDVLWAVEFCSKDITREDVPEDWYIPAEVLVIVKRAVDKLGA
jgi:hypothetical protein